MSRMDIPEHLENLKNQGFLMAIKVLWNFEVKRFSTTIRNMEFLKLSKSYDFEVLTKKILSGFLGPQKSKIFAETRGFTNHTSQKSLIFDDLGNNISDDCQELKILEAIRNP